MINGAYFYRTEHFATDKQALSRAAALQGIKQATVSIQQIDDGNDEPQEFLVHSRVWVGTPTDTLRDLKPKRDFDGGEL